MRISFLRLAFDLYRDNLFAARGHLNRERGTYAGSVDDSPAHFTIWSRTVPIEIVDRPVAGIDDHGMVGGVMELIRNHR